MTQERTNNEKEIRSLKVTKEVWKSLQEMKLKGDYKTLNDVIEELIKHKTQKHAIE
ncbi:MAG: hypothetical protein V1870_02580 [Candidatus Aenigmatarchaeota archaeon]